MNCEVIVVGGGIGGLSVAALLAARGVNVCLFERQPYVGGCVANFEHHGYKFEPTAGLYSGWEAGGTYDRLFAELRIERPNVQRLSPPYVVRLPDHVDITVSENVEELAAALALVFPECAEAAVNFYRMMAGIVQDSGGSVPECAHQPAAAQLTQAPVRFRRFIDIQLQTLTQRASDTCSLLTAALALTAPTRGLFAIRGGAQSFADLLAHSLKQSGGLVRPNSPVLRLAYGPDGSAVGVDLLSGERVIATRAIISNLTLWDTYGKLIGPGRTPKAIAAQLKQLRAWGAYVLFVSIDETATSRLKASRFLVLTELGDDRPYAADEMQFVFSMTPKDDETAIAGQRAVSISTFTDVDEWFSFHEDETAHEEQDQAKLESLWSRVHTSMPELGDSVEVIESLTPRTFYETTRRRLGMMGAPNSNAVNHWDSYATVLPNVFMVGDTVSAGFGLEGICAAAKNLADQIAPSRPAS